MEKNNNNKKKVRLTLDEFKVEFKGKKPDLSINRLPEEVNQGFRKLAKESFVDDFGWALSFLYYYFIDDLKYQDLLERIEDIEKYINKAKPAENEGRKITLAGGKTIDLTITRNRRKENGNK